MGSLYRIKKTEETGSRIMLSTALIQQLGINSLEKTKWNFGLQKCVVTLVPSDGVSDNEILMSGDVIQSLMLPLTPEYEILYDKKEFHIGPIIGIVAAKNMKRLDENGGPRLNRYIREYEKIGGAILAFSNEGIDRDKKQINGYLYNPATKKWEKGNYPYPLAIFKKTTLKKAIFHHFESIIGKRIFNSSTFDKWEMYTLFHSSPDLKPYLPETKLFKTVFDVQGMLEKFDAVYIKPIQGMQGKRVAKIEKSIDKLTVQYIDGETKKDFIYTDLWAARDFLETTFDKEKFIIQQSINLKFNDSNIDFRVIMIKDHTGKWKNFGMLGRTGVKGLIVSNRHRGGKVEQAGIPITRMFGDANKVDEFKEKMENLAQMSAQTIENCGYHFGKLGIDIGIDTEGHLWLIEINHRNPNDFVASFAGDKNLVNQIRFAIMGYAKRLAGFE